MRADEKTEKLTSFRGQFKSFFLSAVINRQGRKFFQVKEPNHSPLRG